MRFVRSAVRRPHRCAAIPFVGMNDPEGFIDTDTEYDGERVYVSVKAVKEMVRIIGWPSKQDFTTLAGDYRKSASRCADLESKVEDLESQLKAIHTLKMAGATTQAKPGRKPKEEAVA